MTIDSRAVLGDIFEPSIPFFFSEGEASDELQEVFVNILEPSNPICIAGVAMGKEPPITKMCAYEEGKDACQVRSDEIPLLLNIIFNKCAAYFRETVVDP